MKRILKKAFSLVVIIALLSGCAMPPLPELTTSSSFERESSQFETEKSSDISSSAVDAVYDDLGITSASFISILNRRLSDNDYPKIKSEIYQEASENIREKGKAIYRKYELIDGMYFVFTTLADSDDLLQITWQVDRNKLNATDYILLGYLEVTLPYLLDPDNDDTVQSRLQMRMEDETLETNAKSDSKEYFYSKNGPQSSLTVVPLGQEAISLDSLIFGEAQQPIWILSDFVEALNSRLEAQSLTKLHNSGVVKNDASIVSGCVGHNYSIELGASIYIYVTPDTQEVTEIDFLVDSAYVTVEGLKKWAFAIYSCVDIFDAENYKKIADSIQLEKTDIIDSRLVSGDYMDYFYMVEDDGLGFLIVQRDSSSSSTHSSTESETPQDSVESLPSVSTQTQQDNNISSTLPKESEVELVPKFEGGLCLGEDIDLYTGMPKKVKAEYSITETVFYTGQITGITGEQNLTISWYYPNGKLLAHPLYYMTNNETINGGQEAIKMGVGEGHVDIVLDSTGDLLASYYFTITE